MLVKNLRARVPLGSYFPDWFIREVLENVGNLAQIEPLRILISGFLNGAKAVVQSNYIGRLP